MQDTERRQAEVQRTEMEEEKEGNETFTGTEPKIELDWDSQ
jgi:hypothetical protein